VRSRNRRFPWANWSDERLLDVRMCDLGVSIEGTWLEEQLARIHGELAARDLKLRPHFWLSEEWFSPEGVAGVAIPFYLTHPRLMRLERRQMLEVEGGTKQQCMMLLRHETGHAVQHGYRLHRRRRWQKLFGPSSKPYPDVYRPNPASRRFVHHLDAFYAQCHPDEDFAETFAVWLQPRSGWRRRYAGWPALKKLEYTDELMREIADRAPVERSRARPWELSRVKTTLREHYRAKRERYSVGYSEAYDPDLKRLFSADGGRDGESAVAFLRRHRKHIRENVSQWTGQYVFTLDQVLKEMIGRCRELKLRAVGDEEALLLDFAILLTMHTMLYVYRGRDWHAV
jgi:hypothetical protein